MKDGNAIAKCQQGIPVPAGEGDSHPVRQETNEVRWFFAIPAAIVVSIASLNFAWWLEERLLPHLSGSFFNTSPELIARGLVMAFATGAFILAGVLVSPSKERKTCFAFYVLSPFFSAPGFHLLIFQGTLGSLVSLITGVVGGGFVGLGIALRIQKRRLRKASAGIHPNRF